VALTFDDCYDPGGWAAVLDVLARERVKATFFCTGQAVLANTALGLRTVREGHAIGSHGWDHADFSRLGFDDSYARLINDRNVWWTLARVVPLPLFRPPYGAYTSTTVAAAGAAGYSAVVLWEVDPYDWRNPGVAAIVSRVVRATTPGAIDLMHTLPQTAAALPTIIHQLRARGYRFMTLPELAAIGTPTPGHWAPY
jgi:peptidoglycan/xylan/chitin deacetylase (PgdA/CDA1 family)